MSRGTSRAVAAALCCLAVAACAVVKPVPSTESVSPASASYTPPSAAAATAANESPAPDVNATAAPLASVSTRVQRDWPYVRADYFPGDQLRLKAASVAHAIQHLGR